MAGLALVPLLEVAPEAVSSREELVLEKFHLSITLLSSSSRSRSASHHTAKFTEGRLDEMTVPLKLKTPLMPPPAFQYSAPRWRGSMSAAMPRPGPSEPLVGLFQ